MTEVELYALLDARGVDYEVARHEAVFTVAEAERVVPKLGRGVKNLFLRDDKKCAFYLVVAPEEARVDLKGLQAQLGSRRLSFASPQLLREMLGLEPGSVTAFGVLADESRAVTLVLDESLLHQRICAHPMVNTATVFVDADDVVHLAEEHGTPVRVVILSC